MTPAANDELRRRVRAATGFNDLGLHQEAWDELEALPPELRACDTVLNMRVHIYLSLGKWEQARVLAESLARRSPENPQWRLSWAYALRREKSVEAAREVLMEIADRHADVALVAYSLACYASVLGELAEATELLKRAIGMDESLKPAALEEPDLEPLWKEAGRRPVDL